jgi:hypothetical protein
MNRAPKVSARALAVDLMILADFGLGKPSPASLKSPRLHGPAQSQ